ncbi:MULTISPECIES: hypothetical protein [unclassified Exiguobacterium]|uniref:hypothetical protein n=1 Tax=unclassified Exiguobacterium TaxID=2644629 RepID=UPI001BE67751|nr:MULTISPECIES: hypothetical protein [unclassified Exiguobacterium]
MDRKYLTEFGLLVKGHQLQLCYPQDLSYLKREGKNRYHLYMICRIPYISFVKDSLEVTTGYMKFSIKVEKEEGDFSYIDYKIKRDNEAESNYDSFELDESLRTIVIKKGETTLHIRPTYFYPKEDSKILLPTEILYVGQSYGNEGERSAVSRLSGHETLQKIVQEHSFNRNFGDIAVILIEPEAKIVSMTNPWIPSQVTGKNNELHEKEVYETMSEESYKSVVNITEAAWIRYFRPYYNEKFKQIFPNIKHTSYKTYYDLDFGSVMVDLDFGCIGLEAYNEHIAPINHPIAEFPFHSSEDRKNMFDLF